MNPKIRIQLSIMMFLQFFIWGAWFVTMGTYLNKIGFNDASIGRAYTTTAWAAVFSPLIVGLVADRLFPAQYVMGALHLIGAVILYKVTQITDSVEVFWMLLAYTLCYMPTLALVNAISFRQMTSIEKEFPGIRVLGTLGWIVAGLLIGYMKVEATTTPMLLAAACSLVMGIYSFTLPHTPPVAKGQKVSFAKMLGLDALQLLKDPSFLVFVVCSLLICIPLTFYYNFTNLFLNETGVQNAAGKMTMGQMSEVFFMLVMPWFFVRLGVKKMLLVGMLAWTVRYVFFAYGNNETLVYLFYIAILLHGICYDFFFVTGQIYVDKKAPEEIRASAQGFIALVQYGVGMVIGGNVSGLIVDHYAVTDAAEKVIAHHWQQIWLIPAGMAAVIVVIFVLTFRDNNSISSKA
ncbi:MAG: nucleoside permease [Candidatus Hydrogenedentes bacterium]|nr:nucleoside permease [Candidatus Hydrogenedentota bacterium]